MSTEPLPGMVIGQTTVPEAENASQMMIDAPGAAS